jgi:hypothetical protein
MIQDANLGKFVNIIKSHKDNEPNDVYKDMVNYINKDINLLIKNEPEFSKLALLNIDRYFIKRGIMTIPYGVSVKGICEQLINDFFILSDKKKNNNRIYLLINKNYHKFNSDFYLNYKELFKLSSLLHNILYTAFPELLILVNYLKNMNKFLKKLNLSTI